MPFLFKALSIPEVILIEPKEFPDVRGYFLETFKFSDFLANNIPNNFVQDNLSFSRKNVIRGMHFQKKPKEQGKLVSVIKGRVLDIAVDIRPESPTFMKWIAVELNDTQKAMLYIPEGFAHGFVSLSEEVYLLYKCTAEYDLKTDSGFRWDDPDINITWPINDPILSEKDKRLPYFRQLLDNTRNII